MLKLEIINQSIANVDDLYKSEFTSHMDHVQEFISNDFKEGDYSIEDINIQKVTVRKNHYFLLLKKLDTKRNDLILAGEMTAGLIHDINNQLSSVIAGVEIIKAIKEEDSFLSTQMDNIAEGANGIAAMVSGASSLFKTNKTLFSDICIADLFEVVTKTSRALLHKTGIELTYNIPKSLDKFKGIDTQLMRVMTNMIKNSKDSIIDLPNSRKWIELKAYDDADNVYIQVKDGGSGISIEIAEKIFKPFFSTKKEGEGSGIGLDVCKRIMKEHKGDISVEKTNKYTGFILSISKKLGDSNEE